jgi:hypothetical protein
MPTFLAAAAASAAGWITESVVRPIAGSAASMTVSLVASAVVFLLAKRFFVDLRGGA